MHLPIEIVKGLSNTTTKLFQAEMTYGMLVLNYDDTS